MLRRTTLKAKSLNPMSKRKIDETNGEYNDRIKLCLRCGGTPRTNTRYVTLNNGQRFQMRTVVCIGGRCEICRQPAGNSQLHPHEKTPRSKGGKLSLENSVMCHDYPCHAIEQNNTLKWRN